MEATSRRRRRRKRTERSHDKVGERWWVRVGGRGEHIARGD